MVDPHERGSPPQVWLFLLCDILRTGDSTGDSKPVDRSSGGSNVGNICMLGLLPSRKARERKKLNLMKAGEQQEELTQRAI